MQNYSQNLILTDCFSDPQCKWHKFCVESLGKYKKINEKRFIFFDLPRFRVMQENIDYFIADSDAVILCLLPHLVYFDLQGVSFQVQSESNEPPTGRPDSVAGELYEFQWRQVSSSPEPRQEAIFARSQQCFAQYF